MRDGSSLPSPRGWRRSGSPRAPSRAGGAGPARTRPTSPMPSRPAGACDLRRCRATASTSSPTVANQLADDTASIDTWWAGQDPTRDLALRPGGLQQHLHGPRHLVPQALRDGGPAQRGWSGERVRARSSACSSRPASRTRSSEYLVYYDGPLREADVCGTGGGDFATRPGLRDRLAAGLPGRARPTAIAAHELLHALGAVPLGDPHTCPGDAAHVCDNPLDVLYPFASGQPLSALFLDFNHDDYYGALEPMAGHPGLAVAPSAAGAPGHARARARGCRPCDQRPARPRLHASPAARNGIRARR